MHELGIAMEIVEAAIECAEGRRVRRIVVEVGALAAVLPDALRFSFDVVTEGSLAEGAVLDIVEVAGRATCRACGAEVVLFRPFGRCACGGSDLEWLSGDALSIRALEVA